MAYFIVLRGPEGERRIPDNTPFKWKAGEVYAGSGHDGSAEVTPPSTNVDAKLEEAGLKLGDAIAWVTHKMGIQQCAPCKARQEILNNVGKHGWAATIKQIKNTF